MQRSSEAYQFLHNRKQRMIEEKPISSNYNPIITLGSTKQQNDTMKIRHRWRNSWKLQLSSSASPKRAKWHKEATSSHSLPTLVQARGKSLIHSTKHLPEKQEKSARVTDNHRFSLDLICFSLFPSVPKSTKNYSTNEHQKRNMIAHYCPFIYPVFAHKFSQKYVKSNSKCLRCIHIGKSDFTHRFHVYARKISYKKAIFLFSKCNCIKVKSFWNKI